MYPYYPHEDPLVLVPGWVARPPRGARGAGGGAHQRQQRPPHGGAHGAHGANTNSSAGAHSAHSAMGATPTTSGYGYNAYTSPQLPPPASLHNPNTANEARPPSRTVHIRNIAPTVTLSQVLDTIEGGPIEYTKMFTRHSDGGVMQTCVVSFVNSEVCQQFHRRYTKSISNMQRLKMRLHHSDSLQIVVNDASADSPGQDLIKLKTLNYILDHGATRAVALAFTLDDIPADLVFTHEREATASRAECAHSFIHHQCTKLGDVERFDVALDEAGATGTATVHFTSIDGAIKTVEFYTKRVANDNQRAKSGIPRKSKFRYDIKFTSVAFAKDRCDVSVGGGAGVGGGASATTNSRDASATTNSAHGDTSAPGDATTNSANSANNAHGNTSANDDADDDDDIQANTSAVSADDDTNASPLLDPTSGDYPTVMSPPSSAGRMSPPIDNSPPHSPSSSFLGVGASSSVTSAPRPYPYHRHSAATSPAPPVALYPHTPQSPYDHHMAMVPPPVGAIPAPPPPHFANGSAAPDNFNQGNRSIYLGNLHPHTTIEEIANNVRAGGIVESIRYHPEKKVCFITFVDEKVAYQFYINHQLHHQLIIKGVDVAVGWAKVHSGPLLPEVATAVEAGASRNVYIGIRRSASSPAPKLPSEDVLRHDFSQFGDVEQINFFNNRDCGFVNFLNLADAVRVVSVFELPKHECLDHLTKVFHHQALQVYERYHRLKISFGKDRCGNPPKFSFKKKVGGVPGGSTYHLYQDQLHNQVEQRKRQEQLKRQEAMRAMMALSEKRNKASRRKKATSAATKKATDSAPISEVSASQPLPQSPLAAMDTSGDADDIMDECTEDESVDKSVKSGDKFGDKSAVIGDKHDDNESNDVNNDAANAVINVASSPTLSPLKAGEADMVSDSDDDDDVSIIIDSDENPQTTTKPSSRPHKRANNPANGRKKQFGRPQQQQQRHQDNRRQLSRNSSSASLSYYQGSPFMPQQSPGYYYPPAGQRVSSRSPSYSGYYHQAPSPPYPQMSPQGQHYYTLAPSGAPPMVPQVYMSAAPVPHHGGGHQRHYKQQQQMMAQYLAKQAAAAPPPPPPAPVAYGYPVHPEAGGGDYFGDYDYGYKYAPAHGPPPAQYQAPYHYGGNNRREVSRYRR